MLMLPWINWIPRLKLSPGLFFLKIILFTFGGPRSSLLCGFFSSCSEWVYSPLAVHRLLLKGLLSLRGTGSRAQSSQRWLQGSGAQAQALWCTDFVALQWDLPRPRIQPVSPALAGGFFSPEPPGKPSPGLVITHLSILTHISQVSAIKWKFCPKWVIIWWTLYVLSIEWDVGNYLKLSFSSPSP